MRQAVVGLGPLSDERGFALKLGLLEPRLDIGADQLAVFRASQVGKATLW